MRGEKIVSQPKPPPKKKPTRGRPTRASAPALTRAACVAVVYGRAGGRCERCGVPVTRTAWEGHPQRAHVNERLPRSRGGDPCDPANCELLCQSCHLPDGRHAPTVERLRRLLADKNLLGER